jgi:hypothetical protein
MKVLDFHNRGRRNFLANAFHQCRVAMGIPTPIARQRSASGFFIATFHIPLLYAQQLTNSRQYQALQGIWANNTPPVIL